MLENVAENTEKAIYSETDKAWIDAKEEATGWSWIDGGKKFIWLSQKDGWRHIYAIGLDGKEQLLTPGNYDVIELNSVDEKSKTVYFMASPDNAKQSYLYSVPLNGGKATKLSPVNESGSHNYDISPNGKLAFHNYSSATVFPINDVVSLPSHKLLSGGEVNPRAKTMKIPKVEFFK